MSEDTITNPVTGERVTFVETSSDTGGARTIAEVVVTPGGGVPRHQHANHVERIEVLSGVIEVVIGRAVRRLAAGERIEIPAGSAHVWRNASPDGQLGFRATMTPGHPGFELFLRVLFGLGRDGGLRPNGLPRRFSDLALLTQWDPSVLAGPKRLLSPVMKWVARRPSVRARGDELRRRYGETTAPATPLVQARP